MDEGSSKKTGTLIEQTPYDNRILVRKNAEYMSPSLCKGEYLVVECIKTSTNCKEIQCV